MLTQRTSSARAPEVSVNRRVNTMVNTKFIYSTGMVGACGLRASCSVQQHYIPTALLQQYHIVTRNVAPSLPLNNEETALRTQLASLAWGIP